MTLGERRTAFPNVWIESIEVEKPPFDEEGVIQEFVGQGVLREFEILQQADKTPPVMIRGMLSSFEESIGPLRDSFKITYNLIVRVTPPAAEDIAPEQVTEFGDFLRKRRIKTTARAFARAKNPFEPDVIEVGEPRKNVGMSQDQPADFWDVSVSVTK